MPRPRRKDARPRLMAAGLALFSQLGVERVHSNAIARRAGVGIGTFYTHFENKHALLHEIRRRTVTALQDARRAALADAGPEAIDQVRRSVRAAIGFARRHPAAYRITFGHERAGASRQRPQLSESIRPTADGIRRLQAAGRLDPALDAELAARAWSATEVGTLLWWIEDPDRTSAEALEDTLVRLHPVWPARVETG